MEIIEKKGTNEPSELLKIKLLEEQLKDLHSKEKIYLGDKFKFSNTILTNIINSVKFSTKESQKYKAEIQSIKDKLDKVYRTFHKIENIKIVGYVVSYISMITAVIASIAATSNFFLGNRLAKQLVKEYLDTIDRIAGMLETTTDETEISDIEQTLNDIEKLLNDYLEKNPRLYKLVKKHIKDNLKTKETPQNKQGGKLIPRNKFLSIYSLI